jgi:HK97 family phage major capsid protein
MKAQLGFLGDKLETLNEKEGERTAEEYEEMKTLMTDIDAQKAKIEVEERARNVAESLQTGEEESKEETRISYPKEPGFQNFGEYLQAVARAGTPRGSYIDGRPTGEVDRRLYEFEDKEERATGANVSTPSDGGFLVHPQYAQEFLTKVYDVGVLVNRVRRVGLTSNNNSVKFNGIDETSRADGSRWGGLRVYWKDEAAQMTSTYPKLKEITLTLNKLTGLYYSTDELIQDAGALGSYVMQTFPQEFAFKLDEEIYSGDGAGKPLGVLNCNAAVSVAAETGQAATTLVIENLAKMYMRMWNPGKSRGIWVANQDIIPQLLTMGLAVGTGGGPVFISNVQSGPVFTIFGRPLVFIEHAETLGTAGDIMFLDLDQYMFIDKGGIQSAQSIHLKFDYNETAFRWIYRCDGQPLWTSALTPYKGTNTVSPYISLAVRS